ncbi:hypothetical protein [Aureispira anguillae]|uniref:Uncharacterized protein n=1 Tax=Aureispira anguillae TaxID=2864201 RepID=A0A915YD56_9BACT|nr:hypothetical protein [Aureispira anguillae]BDS10878.1 hypothetical protein AsAng_0015880 [Aureispira anguillae]
MNKKPKRGSSTPEILSSKELDFSPTFLLYLSVLKERKTEYLSFLLIVQRLLLRDALENKWSKEYTDIIENNISVLQHIILEA